jgi:hypothetical protein
MTGRRLCGVAILAIAGMFVGDVALRGDEPTPDELLDGPEIRELLAILESEAFRDSDFNDLRSEALRQFGRIVSEGGDGLRDAALRRMQEHRGDDRRRAELVLAQIPELPAEQVRPLLDDEDIEVATWAYLTLERAKVADLKPWTDDTSAPLPAPTTLTADERDPLLDAFDLVREQVEGFELSSTTASHCDAEGERESLVFTRWRLARGDETLHVVLARSGEYRDPAFIAVLRRASADARWALEKLVADERLRHADLVIQDLDGDALPDVAVSYWNGGTPSWGCLALLSASRAGGFAGTYCHGDVRVIRRAERPAPFLLERTPYESNYGGTAVWTLGVVATQYDISTWTESGIRQVGSVWIAGDTCD